MSGVFSNSVEPFHWKAAFADHCACCLNG